jgi:hypothetical protein
VSASSGNTAGLPPEAVVTETVVVAGPEARVGDSCGAAGPIEAFRQVGGAHVARIGAAHAELLLR